MRRNTALFVLAASILIGLSGCQEAALDSNGAPDLSDRQTTGNLTQAYAEFRAERISNIRYGVALRVDPTLDYFAGRNVVRFELSDASSDLTIDFVGGEVQRLDINGTESGTEDGGGFVTLPASLLSTGENTVSLDFTHPWSDDGDGLYRYQDPDDGNVYLYSDFEPYHANKFLPLFDQPDLKGTFTLEVTAPADWHVISTRREESKEAAEEGWNVWSFGETRRIPTYVFSLHAGPYSVWEDRDFRIPLRLFARASLAHYVEDDAEMWFDMTRRGFDFFEEYYRTPYPFQKYDQIIVPDFNAGAMENAGAVTYNERGYLQRDDWSYSERRRLALVIGHEMAHMWFGDLVTMEWWNGLWLNESFATFMGYHAGDQVMGMADAWENFALGRKARAYYLDRGVSTHPIDVEIADVDSIANSFDSITYSKGASVLRQIEFQLGPEVFRDGVSRYLEEYAEGNARLEDFVGALAEASGINLDSWAHEWLYTAGVNTIQATFQCDEGRVTEFALLQEPGGPEGLLRTQKVQVGFYRDVEGVVVTDAVLPVTYSGSRTEVPEATGKTCPDLVYPNHGDRGYLLVSLDPQTREALGGKIARLEDSLQRGMFWKSLWDSARYAEIPVTDFLETALAAGAKEDELNTVDTVFGHAASGISYLEQMGPVGEAALTEYAPRLEKVLWEGFLQTDGDVKTMYFDRYLRAVTSDSGLDRISGILSGEVPTPGLDLDQGRRWSIVKTLASEAHPDAPTRRKAEAENDPSDQGKRWLVSIEASQPNLEVKRKVMADVLNRESENSYSLQRVAMASLFPSGQEPLLEALADESLAAILANEADPDPVYERRARGFANYFAPTTCSEQSIERLEKTLETLGEGTPSIVRLLKESIESDGHCVARKKLIAASSP